MKRMIAKCTVLGLVLGEVSAFSSHRHGAASTRAAKTSQLMMSSSSSQPTRRDILSTAAVGLSALVLAPNEALAAYKPGPPTAQSAANKAAESYQG